MQKLSHPLLFPGVVLALTAAADQLILGHPPGLGWAIFFAILCGGMLLVRPRSPLASSFRSLIPVGILLLLSLVQMAWRPSLSNGIAVAGLTLILAALRSPEAGTALGRMVHTCSSVLFAPLHWAEAAPRFRAGAGEIDLPSGGVLVRVCQVCLPATILAAVFIVLLSGGNLAFGDAAGSLLSSGLSQVARLSFPSILQISFWPVAATFVLGFLLPTRRSGLVSKCGQMLGRRIPAIGGVEVARWSTILALVAVNCLFFIANSMDVLYLWMDVRLPDHLTLAEFTHEGVGNLIACLLLSGVVITLMWCQPREVVRAPQERILATAWIVQNLLLVASVLLRLRLYIDNYQLTLQRLHLVLFLCLVVVGFVLLCWFVLRYRGLCWLATANACAVFGLFLVLQFCDTRAAVARYNIQGERSKLVQLDLGYLQELGPSGWAALIEVANSEAQSSRTRERARDYLKGIHREQRSLAGERDWAETRFGLGAAVERVADFLR